jgi:hypothetical protein
MFMQTRWWWISSLIAWSVLRLNNFGGWFSVVQRMNENLSKSFIFACFLDNNKINFWNMNKILLLSLLLVFASITAAQNTDELWKVVSDKINGSSVARMYVIIGDARGTVFKQTKGIYSEITWKKRVIYIYFGCSHFWTRKKYLQL